MCKTKKRQAANVAAVAEYFHEDSDEDVVFLGSVSEKAQASPWMTEVTMDNHKAVFKIDTGADVTAVPEQLYAQGQFNKLARATKILYGPGGVPLKLKGKFTAVLSNSKHSTHEEVYVVEGLRTPLLSGAAAMTLQLVARVNSISLDSKETVKREFPKLFSGLGKMEGQGGAESYGEARSDFEGDEPTAWCAPMVAVLKSSGRVRICSDLTELNKSVMRGETSIAVCRTHIRTACWRQGFLKTDAKSGFWQIPLSKDSSLLTTFISPFGRYHYNRLCFGISSAPEHFQKRISRTLEGLEGVLCQMDDVLIWGATQREHDERLRKALVRLQEAGVTLNDKCEFSKHKIKFLGQVIEATGVSPDPDKVRAVKDMAVPSNVSEVRSFLGMTNHLGKFLPHLAEKTRPLRDLLRKSNMWAWGPQQQQAFDQIKEELTTPPGLALYDPNADTLVSADASSYGLGAVLLQRQEGADWKPVAYASRALSDTERRYAQIEKEALATTWACERFEEFLIGKEFQVETDHKPLVPLLGSKSLDELPPRIQRLRMRLMRFSYSISHVPGKSIATADVLSRAPVRGTADGLQEEEVSLYANTVIANLPATEKRLREIQAHQDKDILIHTLKTYCMDGWPDKFSIQPAFQAYLPFSGELTVHDGLLLFGCRLVIPASLRADILQKLHEGHLGITKCRERAKQSVWWPSLNKELTQLIESCDTCSRERVNFKEPLQPTDFPSNGEAERAVRTVKALLKKSSDPYLALMAYRAAPLANGHSPAELLMGRKIQTPVPVIPSQLTPGWTDLDNLRRAERRYKKKQKENYDRRHRAHEMPPLQEGDHVWVKDILERGTVVSHAGTPRSYMIETPRGTLRRNRYHLSPTPTAPETPTVLQPDTPGEDEPAGVSTPAAPVSGDDSGQQTRPTGRSVTTRVRVPPGYLKDYVCQ
ncbi:Retrovirus-related Pol polyprotein from transposon 17.6 Protease [Larimichthys crocea]|uniref:Gypsy retrotransposon integrase-like protein 1 n=1 Tax=Larimichthys crocea TaxID=215358 RepID=A0A6G0I047_LARCR|nr:Retrovirus-related Pol polyprotein from transposon 17.6 Protease [Larimichthys crocea]